MEFKFDIVKIKEWIEVLTHLKRFVSTGKLVFHPNGIYTTVVDDNQEDALFIDLRKDMVENYHCKRTVIVGITISKWIKRLRFRKNQHIKLVTCYHSAEDRCIYLEGKNTKTQESMRKSIKIVDIEPSLTQFNSGKRNYPFVMETESKEFYKRCKELSDDNFKWVKLKLDFTTSQLSLEPITNTQRQYDCFKVDVIDNPLQETTYWKNIQESKSFLEEVTGTNKVSDILEYTLQCASIEEIFSTKKLELYSSCVKLNAFVRIYLAPQTELLLESVITHSPTSNTDYSRVEGWMGYRVEVKNDHDIEQQYHMAFMESETDSVGQKRKRKKAA